MAANRGAGARTSGRPRNSKNPTPAVRIQRKVSGFYAALMRSADNGDADSIRLCLEIAKHPENFYGANGQKP